MDVGVARVGVACLAGLFGDVGAFGRPAPRQTRDGRRALLVFGVMPPSVRCCLRLQQVGPPSQSRASTRSLSITSGGPAVIAKAAPFEHAAVRGGYRVDRVGQRRLLRHRRLWPPLVSA